MQPTPPRPMHQLVSVADSIRKAIWGIDEKVAVLVDAAQAAATAAAEASRRARLLEQGQRCGGAVQRGLLVLALCMTLCALKFGRLAIVRA